MTNPPRIPAQLYIVPQVPVPEALKALGLEEVVAQTLSRFWPRPTDRINRYLAKEHKRLHKMAVHNPVAFWKRATFLISHSDAFLLAALRHVRPKWYEGDSFPRVIDWLWSAQRGRRAWKQARGLKTFRPIIASIQLKKPDGSSREISSPKVQARLLLYLWNYCLSMFLDRHIPDNFHGHRKGRGTPTAWADILTNMEQYDYIWEFDLKKFHDSMNHGTMFEALLKAGVPFKTAKDIINLCRAQTVLRDAEVIAQRKADPPVDPPDAEVWPIWDQLPNEEHAKYMQFRGSPQGVATSAILATWTLVHLGISKDPDFHLVSYADDGLIMSDSPFIDVWFEDALDSKNSGVFLNPTKCKWVKRAGLWEEDLQFLGLRLAADEGRVYASSRSGRNKGLYFNVGDDWLSWVKKVDLKDLVTKQSPGEAGYTTAAELDASGALTLNRLQNLPIAIARLFWAGEIHEAFSDTSPPWPGFETQALKVLFKEMFAQKIVKDRGFPLESSSFFWLILVNAMRALHGQEQARDPWTIYYKRMKNPKGGPPPPKVDTDDRRDIIHEYWTDPETGQTKLMGIADGKPAAGLRLEWPFPDSYKRNWIRERVPSFKVQYRDKWASVARAT